MMIRMIKKNGKETQYWQAWNYKFPLSILTGTLGKEGIEERPSLRFWESPKKIVKKLAKEKANLGYEFVNDKDMNKLVVQYRYEEADEAQFEATEKKCFDVEDIIEEALLFTGNGDVSGLEVGAGAGTITIFVVDVEIGFNTIWKKLSEHELTEGVEIAYEQEQDSYASLYPEDAEFQLV